MAERAHGLRLVDEPARRCRRRVDGGRHLHGEILLPRNPDLRYRQSEILRRPTALRRRIQRGLWPDQATATHRAERVVATRHQTFAVCAEDGLSVDLVEVTSAFGWRLY